jgi:hypothetical protein
MAANFGQIMRGQIRNVRFRAPRRQQPLVLFSPEQADDIQMMILLRVSIDLHDMKRDH